MDCKYYFPTQFTPLNLRHSIYAGNQLITRKAEQLLLIFLVQEFINKESRTGLGLQINLTNIFTNNPKG